MPPLALNNYVCFRKRLGEADTVNHHRQTRDPPNGMRLLTVFLRLNYHRLQPDVSI